MYKIVRHYKYLCIQIFKRRQNNLFTSDILILVRLFVYYICMYLVCWRSPRYLMTAICESRTDQDLAKCTHGSWSTKSRSSPRAVSRITLDLALR